MSSKGSSIHGQLWYHSGFSSFIYRVASLRIAHRSISLRFFTFTFGSTGFARRSLHSGVVSELFDRGWRCCKVLAEYELHCLRDSGIRFVFIDFACYLLYYGTGLGFGILIF